MGYALLFPVERIVCAEIEPEVIATSKFFHKVNLEPERDRRLSLEINDGRNYLLATDEKFDVITSEPSNPWQAGVCNLYTREYFQICHDRLNPNGIFAMWWQCNEVSTDDLSRVFSALKKVFKQTVVFQTYRGDITVCSSDQPIKIDLKAVRKAFENKELQKHLKDSANVGQAEDLILSARMADDAVSKVVAEVPENTDDRNFIEFDLSKNYEQKIHIVENRRWLKENTGSIVGLVDWGDATAKEKATIMGNIAERARFDHNDLTTLWARESYKTWPNSFALSVMALYVAQEEEDFSQALSIAELSVKNFPDQSRPYQLRGYLELFSGAPARARHDLETAIKMDSKNPLIRLKLGQTYMPEYQDWFRLAAVPIPDIGTASTDPNKAIELIEPVLADAKFLSRNPSALATLAAALYQVGRTDESISRLEEYMKFKPDDIRALKLLGQIHKGRKEEKEALACLTRANQLSRELAAKLCQQAESAMTSGDKLNALNNLKRALKIDPASVEAKTLLNDINNN